MYKRKLIEHTLQVEEATEKPSHVVSPEEMLQRWVPRAEKGLGLGSYSFSLLLADLEPVSVPTRGIRLPGTPDTPALSACHCPHSRAMPFGPLHTLSGPRPLPSRTRSPSTPSSPLRLLPGPLTGHLANSPWASAAGSSSGSLLCR